MKIVLNGEAYETAAMSLGALLAEVGFSGRVATALNEEFVPATMRDSQAISEGDRVEIVAPMQGG